MDLETALATMADYYYSLGACDGWYRAEAGREPVSESRRPKLSQFKEAMALLNEKACQQDELAL